MGDANLLHMFRLEDVTVEGPPRQQLKRLLAHVRSLPGYKTVADQLSEFDFRHTGSLSFCVQVRTEVAKSFLLKVYWPAVQKLSPASKLVPLVLSTGLSDFDRILGGGLLRGSLVCLQGESGTGKTLLGLWLAHELSKQGVRVVYATQFDHPPELVRYALGISLGLLPATRSGALEIRSVDSMEKLEEIANEIELGSRNVLVVDQIEDFLETDTALVGLVTRMRKAMRGGQGISILLCSPTTLDDRSRRRADGLVLLELPQPGSGRVSHTRTVRVLKHRGLPVNPVACTVHISGRGIEIAEMNIEGGIRPWQIAESLRNCLLNAVERNAEDIFLLEGEPVALRLSEDLLFDKDLKADPRALFDLLSTLQRERFAANSDVDFSFNFFLPDKSRVRFRANLHLQKGQLAATIRPVPKKITGFDSLTLPRPIQNLVELERGLLLVSGPTGSGKSTTIAAILDAILRSRSTHLITIENPIEYEFTGYTGISLIEQREIYTDTPSFEQAVQGVLRQNPQIILLGELRDQETTEAALALAETGHLVVTSVHALSAGKAIMRVANIFTGDRREQALAQLSVALAAVIYQRLLPRADGKGIVPAVEVIRSPDVFRRAMENPDSNFDVAVDRAIYGGSFGAGAVYRLEESLHSLYKKKLISLETLVAHANRLEWLEARVGERFS